MTERRVVSVLREPDRSIFLTDGVVAIAVTLLALDLKPELPRSASSGDLAHYLHQHGSQYFAFLLAFWLIARFWLMHHRLFDRVHHLDAATTTTNLVFLFAITCLPLTTYVQGAYTSALATTLFAANLLLLSVALGLLADLTHRRGLVSASETGDGRRERRWDLVGSTLVPVVVIALAWVFTHAEFFFLLYLVSDVPARLAARGQHAQSAGRSA